MKCVSSSKSQTLRAETGPFPPRAWRSEAPTHKLTARFLSHLTEPWHSLIPLCFSLIQTNQLWKPVSNKSKKAEAANWVVSVYHTARSTRSPLSFWARFSPKRLEISFSALVFTVWKLSFHRPFRTQGEHIWWTDDGHAHFPSQVCTDAKMLIALSSLQMIFPTFLAFLRCLRSRLCAQLYQPPVLAVTEATNLQRWTHSNFFCATCFQVLFCSFMSVISCILEGRRNIFTARLADSFIDRRQRWDRTGAYSLHNTHLQAWRQWARLCPKATTSDCQHLSYILFNSSLKYSKHKKSLGKSRLFQASCFPSCSRALG